MQLLLDGHYGVSTCCSRKVLPSSQRRESNWVAFLISSTFSGMLPRTFRNLWYCSQAGGMAAPQWSRRWTNSEEIHVLMIHKLVWITQCKPSCSATRQSEKPGLLEFNHPVPPSAISMWGQLMIWIDGTTQSIKTPGYMTGFQMQSGLALIKNIQKFNFKQFSCCFFYCCLLPEFLAKKKKNTLIKMMCGPGTKTWPFNAGVQSLVGELRSHLLETKKQKNKNIKQKLYCNKSNKD